MQGALPSGWCIYPIGCGLSVLLWLCIQPATGLTTTAPEAISSKRELTFRSGLVHSFKHVQTGVGTSLGFAGKMEARGSVATFEAPDHQSCFSHWGSLLQAPLLKRGDKPETAQRPYGQAGEPEAMAMLVVSRFFNQRLRADTHAGMESVMSTSLPGGQPV